MSFTRPADATVAVVTGRALDFGVTLHDGDVAAELNGRPVFVLSSQFAFYRDIEAGDSGPDVLALQATLARRGYDVNADGVFGALTERAVRALYRDSGYAPLTRAHASPDEDSEPQGSGITAIPADVAYVPVSELLGVPTLPISVVRGIAVGAAVGVEGTPDAVLGSIERVVSVSTDPSQVADIAEGDIATLVIDSTEVEGRVSSLDRSTEEAQSSRESGGSSSASPSEPAAASFIVTPTAPFVDAAPGTPVRVMIRQQIVSQDSLLVPQIAVTDRGAANRVVFVRRSDESFVEVRVSVLGTLDGQAAVTPEQEGALRVGDEVKVG